MSKVNVRRKGYALGAEITGVDASGPLDDETIAAIWKAALDNIVVYLPGQDLSPEQLKAFGSRFGELDIENTGFLTRLPEMPEVIVRTNKPVEVHGIAAKRSSPANKWHSDYSHTERPSSLTFLAAKQIPDIGGDTMFTNLYMAYDTLSPKMQELVRGLSAIHDFTFSPAYAAKSPEEQVKSKALRPPVVHPLARKHDQTGRTLLYVADRIRNFVGMTEEETKPILDFLMAHATRYEFIYRHRWTANDLLIWDNRCSLHYAVQDYDQSQLRRTLRCSLLGPKSGTFLVEESRTPAAVAVAT